MKHRAGRSLATWEPTAFSSGRPATTTPTSRGTPSRASWPVGPSSPGHESYETSHPPQNSSAWALESITTEIGSLLPVDPARGRGLTRSDEVFRSYEVVS
jgi:hypothetical protein